MSVSSMEELHHFREEGGTVVVEPSKLTKGAATASSYSFDYWYIQFSCVR